MSKSHVDWVKGKSMRRILVIGLAVGLLAAVTVGPASAEEVEQTHWQGGTATFNNGFARFQNFTPQTSDACSICLHDPYVYSYYRSDGCTYEGQFLDFDLQWSINSATISFDTGVEGCGVVEVTWTAIDNGWDTKNGDCFSCRANFKTDSFHHIRSLRFNDTTATLTVDGVLQPVVDAGSGIEKGDITNIRG